MRNKLVLWLLVFVSVKMTSQPNWPLTKSNTTVQVGIPTEFGTAVQQPISVTGWEDGIFISRDGLNLYSIYLPADALSWTINGAPCVFTPYQKGPTYGMDLATSPSTACPMWVHGDVLISTRTSTTLAFTTWSLSNLSGPIYSEGAPQFVPLSNGNPDLFVFTRNNQPPYNADIYLAKNSGLNPSPSSATILPSPVTYTTIEDNPHIERINASTLVLFFDSPDRPGGVGGLDLWYATSNDDGVTWAFPQQVSTLNTSINEHQPHLYKDNLNQWWLYYTAPDGSGKYAIYRAQQTVAGNWDSWGPKQLVVGPGNSAGIGEPTLTQNGDLSFVVIYQDPNGTSTDKFDADPWFLPRTTITNIPSNSKEPQYTLYPNPSQNIVHLKNSGLIKTEYSLYDITGKLLRRGDFSEATYELKREGLDAGTYFISLTNEEGESKTFKLVFTD